MMKTGLLLLLGCAACLGQTWIPQQSGSTSSLRGVSAVGGGVVWGSGTGGTWLRTTDGGATWQTGSVPGADGLDFRGIRAFDAQSAVLMSSGPGDKSKIYATGDAGKTWKLLFQNPDATGFFDSIAFADRKHGLLMGDRVGGQMTLFRTSDGGSHWSRVALPPAVAGEGGFAASNSCISLDGKNVRIATGGKGTGRVYLSSDSGSTWKVVDTPIRKDSSSAGIFSIAFSDRRHGIVVGGEYTKAAETDGNIALTSDGGRTWLASKGTPPAGYRSSVAYMAKAKIWITTGTSGSDISGDGGANWRTFDSKAYNAISVAPDGSAWAVGPKGSIASFQLR